MIYELLGEGEENAITACKLSGGTGLCVRDVTELIRLERLAGNAICSNHKGYFQPKDKNELNATISRLYKQARETRRVAEKLKDIKGV